MRASIGFDHRWVGSHGIGRFASEIKKRVSGLDGFSLPCRPTNPLDCFLLSLRMLMRPGYYFSPGYNAPLVGLGRYIFTVHDLNHIDLPYNSSPLKRLYYRLVLKRGCRKALRILTVSEFSRRRIIEWAGVAETQVVNVGNGVDRCFTPLARPYTPGYEYLLCVGNRKRHKNELRLLDAFSQSKIDPKFVLLFTGCPDVELSAKITALGIEERVKFSGFVKDEDLPGLYTGARAVLFPSLYEGFGLPVVEAMACGVPVLTSNVTSLPEVAGDGALLVDPYSMDDIAAGIAKIASDEALRQTLVDRGLHQAKYFSWDAVAEKVAKVLKECKKGG